MSPKITFKGLVDPVIQEEGNEEQSDIIEESNEIEDTASNQDTEDMLAFEELKDEMAEKMEEMEDRIMDEHEHQLEQVKKEYKKLIRDLEDRLTKRYDKKISEETKKRELADKELQEDIEGVGYRLKKVKRTVNDEELRYKRSLASKNLVERYDELEKLRELPTFTPTSVINNVQIARNARSFKLDLY